MIREVFLRNPYNYDVDEASNECGIDTGSESQTQQNMKDDADINVIVKRFGITGQLPSNVKMPQYGDFTGITDYQTALNAVIEADESFMKMDASVRARFGNNAALFVEWCSDPKNMEEAVKMGLAVIVKEAPVVTPDVPPVVDEKVL